MQSDKTYISDAVDIVLEANFDSNKGIAKFIDGLIASWGQVGADGNVTNQAGMKSAIKVLYQAINSPEEMQQSLAKLSGNPAYRGVIEGLYKLSKACNEEIREENKDVFAECKKLYNKLSDEDLEIKIRNYFKDKSNFYLKDKSPHIFDELEKTSKRQSSGQTIN